MDEMTPQIVIGLKELMYYVNLSIGIGVSVNIARRRFPQTAIAANTFENITKSRSRSCASSAAGFLPVHTK